MYNMVPGPKHNLSWVLRRGHDWPRLLKHSDHITSDAVTGTIMAIAGDIGGMTDQTRTTNTEVLSKIQMYNMVPDPKHKWSWVLRRGYVY